MTLLHLTPLCLSFRICAMGVMTMLQKIVEGKGMPSVSTETLAYRVWSAHAGCSYYCYDWCHRPCL